MYELVEIEKVMELEHARYGVLMSAECNHHLSADKQLKAYRLMPLSSGQRKCVSTQLLEMPVVIECDGSNWYNQVYVKSPAGWAKVTNALCEELYDLTMGLIPIDPNKAADYLTGHRNSMLTLQALAAIRYG